MWVIVGCGNAKHDHPMPAADLYRSVYIRRCVAWARSVVPEDRLLILSAKYGLIPGTTVIPPYHSTFGSVHGFARTTEPLEPPIAPARTGEQVAALGVTDPVVLLAGRNYYAHLAAAAPTLHPTNPFLPIIRAAGHDTRTGYQAQEIARWMGRVPA